MNGIERFNNLELQRQTRTLTTSQSERAAEMRKGVIVDNMINVKPSLSDVCDALIISDNEIDLNQISRKPQQKSTDTDKSYVKSAILPLCAATVGLTAGLAAITGGLLLAARNKAKLPAWKTLPEVARNINLNDEKFFVTYAALQNPNVRTIVGALGVFVFASAALIARNCVDGFKDTWIKRQEADIQRNLQEKLIKVEAQTFAGKINFMRGMLAEKAKEFEELLNTDAPPTSQKHPAFRKFINFKGNYDFLAEEKPQKKDLTLPLLAGVTTVAVVGLTYLSLKNLQKAAKLIDTHKANVLKDLEQMVGRSNVDENGLTYIKKALAAVNPKSEEYGGILSVIKKKVDGERFGKFESELKTELEKISQTPPEAFAGTPSPRPSYFSYIDNILGHFYNWVVNFDNPFLGSLFAGIAGVSGLSYVGTRAVEAVRSVQVSKVNAKTELDLQQRLVEVEIKNFETKKRVAVAPLVREFKLQSRGEKDKDRLKNMAANILYEIKNGPPYIYS